MNVEYGTVSILGVIQVPGLKQLCKQFLVFCDTLFLISLVIRALLLMDVPFLPSGLLLFVSYSTFLCLSLLF